LEEDVNMETYEFDLFLKIQELKNGATVVCDELENGNSYISIKHKNELGINMYIMISKNKKIKNILEFNDKCSDYFGFKLKMKEMYKDWRDERRLKYE
jgi:hypothetical protein